MAKCRHTHAWFVIDRHSSRRVVWGIYQAWMVHNDPHFGYGDMDTVISASCRCCGEHLSLGPSNDDIQTDETMLSEFAESNSYWSQFENSDGYDWDVSRPLAEQWPWGPADHEHMARGDAMLDEVIDNPLGLDPESVRLAHEDLAAANTFAAVDTASREPWHTTQETQLSEACDAAVDALDRAETKLRASVDAFAELVTVVPDGAA